MAPPPSPPLAVALTEPPLLPVATPVAVAMAPAPGVPGPRWLLPPAPPVAVLETLTNFSLPLLVAVLLLTATPGLPADAGALTEMLLLLPAAPPLESAVAVALPSDELASASASPEPPSPSPLPPPPSAEALAFAAALGAAVDFAVANAVPPLPPWPAAAFRTPEKLNPDSPPSPPRPPVALAVMLPGPDARAVAEPPLAPDPPLAPSGKRMEPSGARNPPPPPEPPAPPVPPTAVTADAEEGLEVRAALPPLVPATPKVAGVNRVAG